MSHRAADAGSRDAPLRAELLARMERDQQARAGEPGTAVPQDLQDVDRENTRWLAALVQDRGWPGRSEVGEDGALAAWLLAQHADLDPAFQRRCLVLLAGAVDAGEADPSHLAYLTDRVRLREGRPQVYGTQVSVGPDGYRPRELADPGAVDELRAGVGLPPLAEYLASFERVAPPQPSVFPCQHCGTAIEFWPSDTGTVDLDCPGCGWRGGLTLS